MVGRVVAAVSDAEALTHVEHLASDPAWFCREVLGCAPYPRQIEIIEAVRDHEQVSVVGANAVGKDWMTGRIICWWQCSHYPAKTIITGPTARQVSDIVWREVRQTYHGARIPLGGRMTPVEARWEGDDQHFALGFSTDRAWNLQGFHSPNLLVVVTEAHGFSDADLVALKRLLPNRLLLTGNPFADAGEFYESHHGKQHIYRSLSISAMDSPNVQAGAEIVPGLVTQRDIDRMAADWGEDNPLFKATVAAEFVGRPDGLIPLAHLQAARVRDVEPADTHEWEAGIDVSGPGEDETVACVRQGPTIRLMRAWGIADSRGEVLAALAPYKDRLKHVNVDSVGLGYYFARHLEDNGYQGRVIDVNVGEAARDSEKYVNLKAELYWGLRLRAAAGDLAGLTDDTARSQLAGIRYKHNARGQVVIESKDESRKRGVKSPDRAEAVMLAFAPAPPPAAGGWIERKPPVIKAPQPRLWSRKGMYG